MSQNVNTNTFFLNPFEPSAGRIIVSKKVTKKSPLPYWRLERSEQPHHNIGRCSRSELPHWLNKQGISFHTENPNCVHAVTIGDVLECWFSSHREYYNWNTDVPLEQLRLLRLSQRYLGKVCLSDLTKKLFSDINTELHRKIDKNEASDVIVFMKDVLCWLSRNNVSLPFNPFKLSTNCHFIASIRPSVKEALQKQYPETYLSLIIVLESGIEVSYLPYIKLKHLDFIEKDERLECVRLDIYSTKQTDGYVTREGVQYIEKIRHIFLYGPVVDCLALYQGSEAEHLFREDIVFEITSNLNEILSEDERSTFRSIKSEAKKHLSSEATVIRYEFRCDEDIDALLREVDRLLPPISEENGDD